MGTAVLKPSLIKDLPDADSALLEIKPKEFSLSDNSLEVLLTPDFHTWDGQFSNNGWMMECPANHKLTWDNALLISPVLAKKLEQKYPNLGLLPKATMLNETGQIAPDAAVFEDGKQKAPVVTLKVGDHHEYKAPLYVQPGLADYTVVSTIGQGCSRVGRVGLEQDLTAVRFFTDSNRISIGATIEPTGDFHPCKCSRTLVMEGRAIVRETNAKYYSEHEDFAQKWEQNLILHPCGEKIRMRV